MDVAMAPLALAGVRAVPNFYGRPAYAYGKHASKPPRGKLLDRWKSVVRASAARYGKGGISDGYGTKPHPVTEWQVWNGPNTEQFWHPRPQPKRVCAAREGVRRGPRARGARLVLAGMFPDAKVSFNDFMHRLYEVTGIRGSFEEVAVHPYASTVKALDASSIRCERRCAATAILTQESGSPSWAGCSKDGEHRLRKGLEGQARLLRSAFELVKDKRARWNLTGVSWFALRDTASTYACEFCTDSGLLDLGAAPKPAWEAFKAFSGG
jgi:hypothetical protein